MTKQTPNKPNAQNESPDNQFHVRLAKPAIRALNNAGIKTLEQLTHFRESEIADLHGIGPNAINQLQLALSSRGLTFKK
jgi:DNA-directed RNA polymerase alpha subunit